VIDQEDQWARSAFYEKHNIAFVARPPLGRRGVFKKASNLNFQLAVSDRVCELTAGGLSPSQALLKVGVAQMTALQGQALSYNLASEWSTGLFCRSVAAVQCVGCETSPPW